MALGKFKVRELLLAGAQRQHVPRPHQVGGLVLLVLVFLVSSFLDNIAAALIGATVAKHVFKDRVRVGYLAAIVAAANAGGAGKRDRRHDNDNALDRRSDYFACYNESSVSS